MTLLNDNRMGGVDEKAEISRLNKRINCVFKTIRATAAAVMHKH